MPNKKIILKNDDLNKFYSLSDNTLIHLPDATNENIILHGIEQGKDIQLNVPFNKHRYIINNQDGSQTITEEETNPYSVYDYISEFPTVLVYTETMDNIIISTTTESFDIYDEFDSEVEVLYYTDREDDISIEMTVEANWSPIDELDGDLEVATWTDEEDDTAKRTIELSTVPKPQFVYRSTIVNVYNDISRIIASDISTDTNNSTVRFLLTNDNVHWYTYINDFVPVVNIEPESILQYGLTTDKLTSLTKVEFEKWKFDKVNIGVFLSDDIRDNNISKVSNIGVAQDYPVSTPVISDASFYILNTTAQINIDFSGLTLTGTLDDADLTRVQYRVKLNGEAYYPDNGEFTALSSPPLNIDLTLKSEDIKIGDWNTIEVEFQDYFGTTDSWSAQFIGKYAGLMFMDENGDYYSTDVGQVIKYLDFGEILTGQITPSYEIKVKNEFGFDVKDTKISVDKTGFADGLDIELANGSRLFEGNKELLLGDLANEAETSFFIRMVSTVNTVPNNNSQFNIVVTATKAT